MLLTLNDLVDLFLRRWSWKRQFTYRLVEEQRYCHLWQLYGGT